MVAPGIVMDGGRALPANELLRVEGICKAFPGVRANDDVSLDLRCGEILALLGENGAGKTTLMSILFGLHRPDAGTIVIEGELASIHSPRDAIKRGIGFVQQHFSLVPTLSVLDNIILNEHFGIANRISRTECIGQIRMLAERYGLSVDYAAKVETLSIAEQQRVELVKALLGRPRVLILDEPASLLSAQEVEQLWRILRHLANEGVGIILISHKLEDVLTIADRITVLRRGKKVGTLNVQDADAALLGQMMVGDSRGERGSELTPSSMEVSAAAILNISDLWVAGDRIEWAVRGISLAVRRGEILGIAGLEGSGQVELLEALSGVRRPVRGAIELNGESIASLPIHSRQARGLAYIPPDRHRDGLVGTMSIADNLALCAMDEPAISKYGILRPSGILQRANRLIERFNIRAADPGVLAEVLSGGNQQRLILARELARDPDVILCCYPTRGLDFAACAAVHSELRRSRHRGAAIIVVSTDLDELLDLADRIVVMQGGRIVGERPADRAYTADIGTMMGGSLIGS
jgi:ABC-type uncharacterized transport system ATPase subunit